MMFPRSKTYDPIFVRDNMMGPNAMKTLEELSSYLELKPGMRVLDLGCGRGLTSIFLSKEFGVKVFAVDLWINAEDNFKRFKDFGLEDSIIPLHLDAHNMPFAAGYFDMAVCVDAYHYFGAEAGYLEEHLVPLVKPGGQIAIAVPGFQREYGQNIPKEISEWVKPEFEFHSKEWWAGLWNRSGMVTVNFSRDLDCCAEAWSDWLTCDQNEYALQDRPMIAADGGKFFSVVGMIATRD